MSVDRSGADGFYAIYFAGTEGEGVGLLVIADGILVGVDGGGVKFDGKVAPEADGNGFSGKVHVSAPPGMALIQGIATGENGIEYDIGIHLPFDFQEIEYISISTPFGTVNAKFIKLREWP